MQVLRNISDKNNISLDLACYFVKPEYTTDNNGNQVQEDIPLRMAFCAELPISSNEFYKAGKAGIKPECLLLINTEEYCGEKSVVYNEISYSIYRTYPRSDGYMELYCKED